MDTLLRALGIIVGGVVVGAIGLCLIAIILKLLFYTG